MFHFYFVTMIFSRHLFFLVISNYWLGQITTFASRKCLEPITFLVLIEQENQDFSTIRPAGYFILRQKELNAEILLTSVTTRNYSIIII